MMHMVGVFADMRLDGLRPGLRTNPTLTGAGSARKVRIGTHWYLFFESLPA